MIGKIVYCDRAIETIISCIEYYDYCEVITSSGKKYAYKPLVHKTANEMLYGCSAFFYYDSNHYKWIQVFNITEFQIFKGE